MKGVETQIDISKLKTSNVFREQRKSLQKQEQKHEQTMAFENKKWEKKPRNMYN